MIFYDMFVYKLLPYLFRQKNKPAYLGLFHSFLLQNFQNPTILKENENRDIHGYNMYIVYTGWPRKVSIRLATTKTANFLKVQTKRCPNIVPFNHL